jgi:hypothetical protein
MAAVRDGFAVGQAFGVQGTPLLRAQLLDVCFAIVNQAQVFHGLSGNQDWSVRAARCSMPVDRRGWESTGRDFPASTPAVASSS